MNKNHCKQENIRLGTHGEDYGSWMSNPVFYIIGGIGFLAAVLAVLSFYVLHVAVLGVLFTVITIAILVLLIWITWIRRQYAFGGGGIMEQVHRVVLSHLDYDGEGKILEVGCGSGALIIRSALTRLDITTSLSFPFVSNHLSITATFFQLFYLITVMGSIFKIFQFNCLF